MKPEIPYEVIEKGFFQSVTWQRGLLALGMFVGFFLLAKLSAFLLSRLLRKYTHVGGSRHALSKLLSYFIVSVGVVSALSALGLPLSSVVLTSSALLIGIGFSLQHTTRDLVSGIVLLVEQRIRTGDFVTVADISGTVEDIGLRSTCVLTPDGETLVVPNQVLVTSELSNQSYPHRRARLNINVPVAFEADTDGVAQVLLGIAAGHTEVLTAPPPVVRFDGLLGTHFELTLIVWAKEPTATRRIASELRFIIAREFAQRGMPFPRSELRLLDPDNALARATPEPH